MTFCKTITVANENYLVEIDTSVDSDATEVSIFATNLVDKIKYVVVVEYTTIREAIGLISATHADIVELVTNCINQVNTSCRYDCVMSAGTHNALVMTIIWDMQMGLKCMTKKYTFVFAPAVQRDADRIKLMLEDIVAIRSELMTRVSSNGTEFMADKISQMDTHINICISELRVISERITDHIAISKAQADAMEKKFIDLIAAAQTETANALDKRFTDSTSSSDAQMVALGAQIMSDTSALDARINAMGARAVSTKIMDDMTALNMRMNTMSVEIANNILTLNAQMDAQMNAQKDVQKDAPSAAVAPEST